MPPRKTTAATDRSLKDTTMTTGTDYDALANDLILDESLSASDMANLAMWFIDQAGLSIEQQTAIRAVMFNAGFEDDDDGNLTLGTCCDEADVELRRGVPTCTKCLATNPPMAVAADGREYHGQLMADLDNLGWNGLDRS